MLALGSSDRTIKLWETGLGKVRQKLEGHTDEVTAVTFAPDGTMLASGSQDCTVKLWDAGSEKALRTLEGRSVSQALPMKSGISL